MVAKLGSVLLCTNICVCVRPSAGCGAEIAKLFIHNLNSSIHSAFPVVFGPQAVVFSTLLIFLPLVLPYILKNDCVLELRWQFDFLEQRI